MQILKKYPLMHELSIAQNIVEIVEEEAKKYESSKVESVILEIGTMSGVVPEALNFALTEAVKNTILEHTNFEINEIKAVFRCSSCGNEFSMNDLYGDCPECGNFFNDIIKGKELLIKSVNLGIL